MLVSGIYNCYVFRGAALTDEEFLSLSLGAANRALKNISDEEEVQRLQELYWEKNSVIVGPTSDVQTRARNVASHSTAIEPTVTNSQMLFWGRIVFVAAIIGAVASCIGMETSDNFLTNARFVVFLYIFGVAFGFGALMWMIGAVEERLLEIRSILSARQKR